jgi:cell division protein FtsZ
VTVIAAGFDSGQLPYKKVDIRREPAAVGRPGAMAVPPPEAAAVAQDSRPLPPPPNGVRTPVSLDDELDVPDFLKS